MRHACPSLIVLMAASLLPACLSSSTETGNPPAIDTARIELKMATAGGEVVVEGEPGAVTPGDGQVTVKNETTGEETTVDVAQDGSFSAQLPGSLEDSYSVSATGPGGTSASKPISGDPITGDWQTPHRCTGDEPSDPLVVDEVSIDGDVLTLTVSHSGGCATHTYGLCWEDAWNESYPVQNGVRVLHDAGGDMCEAYLTDTISLDLAAYRAEYAQLYRSEFGIIDMSVAPCADAADCSVRYDFDCPADASECPEGCAPLSARPTDGAAMCALDASETVACIPADAAVTDDEVCAVRARDAAVFLSSTGSLIGLGAGAWSSCDDSQALAAQELCAP